MIPGPGVTSITTPAAVTVEPPTATAILRAGPEGERVSSASLLAASGVVIRFQPYVEKRGPARQEGGEPVR